MMKAAATYRSSRLMSSDLPSMTMATALNSSPLIRRMEPSADCRVRSVRGPACAAATHGFGYSAPSGQIAPRRRLAHTQIS